MVFLFGIVRNNLNRRRVPPFIIFMLMWVILGTVGCTQWRLSKPPLASVEKIPNITTMAIIPFDAVDYQKTKTGRGASCPVCGALFRGGRITPGAAEKLTDLFHQRLRGVKGYTILPLSDVKATISDVLHDDLKTPNLKVAIQVGEELNADGVLVGFVFRYQEREGYAYSVKKPASVAFELHLISVKEKRSVWNGSFDETQKSLSENILKLSTFLKRGTRWLTADELAEYGVGELLKRFPEFER